MKTLLVFTTNYDNSKSLIAYALDLARELSLTVQVLYVENPVHHPFATPDLSGAVVAQLKNQVEEQVKIAIEKLDEQIRNLMNGMEGEVPVELGTAIGKEVDIIGEKVDSGQADQVMIEGHGINSLSLKDSVAMDLVRKINCPVWVIPEVLLTGLQRK